MNINRRLRKEKSNQQSGYVNMNAIDVLKERHYYPIDISLDGDQPKEYIKAYFYYKNCPKRSSPSKWSGFFAKFGGKSYPHESVIEYVINQIGECLGLSMNETRLVQINGQVRFLSKDFIKKGQKLVHGVEIIAEYLQDRDFVDEINRDRKNRREFLTFDVIERAIQYVYPKVSSHLLLNLVRLVSFDAIVGNNDRHFYNWGIIDNVVKIDATDVFFSPIYDSARALLWNKTDQSLVNMYKQYKQGSNQLDAFIRRSKPRFSFEANTKADHFELLRYLSTCNSEYKKVILPLISENMEEKVLELTNQLTSSFFREDRCVLINAILKKRFNECRKQVYL